MSPNPFDVYNSSFGKKKYGPKLDWEESLGNEQADSPEDFYEAHNSAAGTKWLGLLLILIFGCLAFRLGFLQVVKGSSYRALADANHIRIQPILAPRGIIYDSQGQPLVQNVASPELVVTPMDLPKQHDQELSNLAKLIPFDVNALQQQLAAQPADSYQEISVAPGLDHNTQVMFDAHASEFPGFSIAINPVRNYLNSTIFSDVLGYTGKISAAELAANSNSNYLLDDYIGKTGVELSYEKYLRGTSGSDQVEVDANGKIKFDLGEIQPQPGDNVYLNIDAGLQNTLYNAIEKYNPGKKAAAVAVNPETGQVLAMVSIPSYDNNLFSTKISPSDYAKLINDPAEPMLNRAIGGLYPPGSTIKPVMASAALQEGVVTPETKIDDNGDLKVGSYNFHGWNPGGLGMMDVRSAIAMSSDIYFYTVGGGQTNLGINGLGPENIEKYDKLFGMGQKLGIDLQGEQAGLVGGPEERQARYGNTPAAQWYLGDTYHESIGQGDMLVTPLQDAMWTATVANGGTLYRPYVVNKVVDNSGKVVLQNQPQAIRSGFISPQNIEVVREGMHQTVTAGTAKLLAALPITSGAKTGTAQFDTSHDPEAAHAWFAAFAPYNNPQIAISVLIEAGGEGSTYAAPVVRDTLMWWANNRYLTNPANKADNLKK